MTIAGNKLGYVGSRLAKAKRPRNYEARLLPSEVARSGPASPDEIRKWIKEMRAVRRRLGIGAKRTRKARAA